MNPSFRPTPLAALLLALFSTPGAHAASTPQTLGEVTVTGTREGRLVAETPATVVVVKEETIRNVRPTHPSQILGQVPGVWINVTGGEGHQTAIRQPLTTGPVYLYLEDGIPTRATGFFNHNALFETNVPQAGGIEVNKGPGTALYGSDAIGGVVNVLTRKPPLKGEFEASAAVGSNGWRRALLGGGNAAGDGAYRADVNLTHTDGWRQRTGYDRESAGFRWDGAAGSDGVLKLIANYSHIDQQTAGSSAISRGDYENNPTRNYTPISFRKVEAFRLSAAYDRESADSLLSVTPYVRFNDMDLLANWSLSYDPTVYNTRNRSFGVMAKYRQDFAPLRARIIVGVDVDNSPGRRQENAILTTSTGSGVSKVYTSYTTGARVYDYDVTYRGISPYMHGEISPVERLRLTAGLRYDDIRYDYDNKLASAATSAAITGGTKWYGHAANTSVSFGHLSPKLGATWQFSEVLNGFANYNHAFRAPSEDQLFRPSSAGSAADAQVAARAALNLKPIKVDSLEAGLRGKAAGGVSWEASVYHMVKRDDIVSYKDPATDQTTPMNAGRTSHEGIELGAGIPLPAGLRLDLAYSWAKHRYDQWTSSGTDFSGKEIAAAPRLMTNTRLSWDGAEGRQISLEWVKLGSYWLDDANTRKYNGHDLFNLRGQWPVAKGASVFANIQNLFDRRYAEKAQISSSQDVYAPGLPRTVYAGVQVKW